MSQPEKTIANILSEQTIVIDDDYLLIKNLDLFVVHAYGIALLGIPSESMYEKVMTRMQATTNIDLAPEGGISTRIAESAGPVRENNMPKYTGLLVYPLGFKVARTIRKVPLRLQAPNVTDYDSCKGLHRKSQRRNTKRQTIRTASQKSNRKRRTTGPKKRRTK
jgi:hypothetical protein